MACACFTRTCQSSSSVRDAPGLFCQGCARSVPGGRVPPSPLFFVSVASKGLSHAVSLLFATLARGSISVASKGLTLHKNCANSSRSGSVEHFVILPPDRQGAKKEAAEVLALLMRYCLKLD